jgi:tetratricopeptide (TPR) repeat protein
VMSRLRNSVTVASLAFALGCAGGAGTAPPPEPASVPATIPAGVDSLVAILADSLADVSFVEPAEQDEATALQEEGRLLVERTDSLWLVMSALIDSTEVVSAADSIDARAAADDGGVALVELDDLLRTTDVEVDSLAQLTAGLLDRAQASLERAFQLNPFDTRSRTWLAQVYGLQARRLGQNESYGRAIDELEKLALLTPDQHTVYAMLANNYFYVENWDGAVLNYQSAESTYRATYDLVVDDTPPLDSAIVFSYVQAQGDMHVRRLDAARATQAYERALGYTAAEEDMAYITGELDWMAWDDNNIVSAFTRDSLLALEQDGELQPARDGYADLLSALTAGTAIDETEWRLAIVDYNIGSTEEAADRLQALVARTPKGSSGAPVDPQYQRYFDDYGTLCLNLGRTFRVEQRDSRTALKYFTQATQLTWSGRSVAHFEVARLVQGNPPVALENATTALEGEETMTVEQRLDLYRLLMELTRRTGDFERAREYRDSYRALSGG